MPKTASELFVIKMVRACLPLTPTRLNLNGEWMDMIMEDNMHSTCSGVMSIKIYRVEPTIQVTYNLTGTGDGETWTKGGCTISLSSNPDESWEFYCEQEAGGLVATPMVTMRRRSALKKVIEKTVADLGGNKQAVARRLQQFGFTANAEGIRELLDWLFGVFTILTEVHLPNDRLVYEYFVTRSGNPDIQAMGELPGAVVDMILDRTGLPH